MIRVDLRSDTVSHPSPEMMKAMSEAELGDDVYGDDPTVNCLQEKSADILGKEDAVFVASGTMSNLVAILAQTQRGDEVIVGSQAHIFRAEAGGASVLGGVNYHAVTNEPDGTMPAEGIEAAVRPDDIHMPPTSLLCLENTHNGAGGAAVTPSGTRAMTDVARAHGLRVHMDGARLFNASVALECPVSVLVEDVDTVGFCLSKGLSCPIGSVLAGDASFVDEARKWRKIVGGSMRQVGIIAAAGIVALETMVERMADDHSNARRLAEGLANIDGIGLDLERVQTNIIRFSVPQNSGIRVASRLADEGVLINPTRSGEVSLRMVTHYGIDASDIEFTLSVMNNVMSEIA